MDYKLKRQLAFGSGFIVVMVLLFFIGFQLFTPKASCTDGRLNQGEEKVDCGGPCAACKEIHLADVDVQSYYLIPSGDTYDAIAEVRNPNSDYGVPDLEYSFRFYDSVKNILGEKKGSTYLLAGQTRYIIESNASFSSPAAYVSFSVLPGVIWQLQAQLTGQLSLPIFSKKFETISAPGIGYAKVSGTVQNQTEYTFSTVDIHVMLVDAAKQPIAVGETQINNLRFGESRSFVVLFPTTIVSPSDIYAEATTDAFDQSNIH